MSFNALEQKISSLNLTPVPDSYFLENIQSKCSSGNNPRLTYLNEALSTSINATIVKWVDSKLHKLICEINSSNVKSEHAAEITAAGLMARVFPNLRPIVRSNKDTSPDIQLDDSIVMEIYCPQESDHSFARKIESVDSSSICKVDLAITFPVTGSKEKSLEFSANQTIARIVSGKRENDQTKSGKENILWLDLINGLSLSSQDSLPYISIPKDDFTVFGNFGLWHAFYGKKEISTFAAERASLMFIDGCQKYQQKKYDGLFRDRKNLSAALILTEDGIILYENPWSIVKLSEENKAAIMAIYKFRPEYSWFSIQDLEEKEIENELEKISWMLKNAENK